MALTTARAGTRLRFPAVLAVLVGAAAVAGWAFLTPARADPVAAARPTTTTLVSPAKPVSVAVFGDSITDSAVAHGRIANAALDDPLQVSWDTAPYLSTYHFQAGFEEVAVHQPDVVVIATGTNDSWEPIGAAQEASIDDALDALAANPCVVWVNVRSEIGPNDVDWNRLLAEKAAAAGNVRVADWDGYSNGHAEWIDPDNVHLSDQGQVAYAAWLVEQMGLGCS